MPGKRKRVGIISSDAISSGSQQSAPISAAAAARSKAHIQTCVDISRDESPNRSNSTSMDAANDDYEDSEQNAYMNIEDAPTTNRQLSTWRYSKETVLSESEAQVTVILEKASTISLIGCFYLMVLKGAINVNGANVSANPRKREKGTSYHVFVPSTHPITAIRGLDRCNEIQFQHCPATAPFSSICPLFSNIWNASSKGPVDRSFTLIRESNDDLLKRSIFPAIIPDGWTSRIENCTEPSATTMIIGPSSSGKSAFAKQLLNRYLTGFGKRSQALSSVFYLDLDPSKPEFTPHGQISLVHVREVNLGPSFTHPAPIPGSSSDAMNELVRAHPLPIRGYLGDQEHFLACFEDLFQTYVNLRQQTPFAPLVIDTLGLDLTSNKDLLLKIIARIRLRYLIYVESPFFIAENTSNEFKELSTVATQKGTTLLSVEPLKLLDAPTRTNSEIRSMQMLSYFHCNGFTNSSSPQRTYSSKPCSFMKPWDFCYEETATSRQGFIGFLTLCEWIPPSELLTALNGSLIQIVETEDPNIQKAFHNLPRTGKFRIPYFNKSKNGSVEPPDPRTSRLVCTALIRGFDPERRVAQVLVPKTHEVLMYGLKPEKTIFVFGCCEFPEWAYMEDAYYDLWQQGGENAENVDVGKIGIDLPPWVATAQKIEALGSLNTVRRVRKFHQ
ncbi:uncharacterized protein BDR25DRAFT_345282 [Lindgomyces ingoldianus]|uniref:Uncharacterized protein n=1 Tax=Lindgomyces ingoldianus TaxID=673940 RepID=A0ACB6QIH7_9PLEO|nr:uncharacterized protein BDR25DRAFT_345282 [Lindgomyces ingoldianus]KAF2466667.1 hypothetical protein BDR25DRAFT_345282 [Lindgomyces ingoldianus]